MKRLVSALSLTAITIAPCVVTNNNNGIVNSIDVDQQNVPGDHVKVLSSNINWTSYQNVSTEEIAKEPDAKSFSVIPIAIIAASFTLIGASAIITWFKKKRKRK